LIKVILLYQSSSRSLKEIFY